MVGMNDQANEPQKTSAGRLPGGQFLESPDNFSGPWSCFMFVGFEFKINASII